MCVHSQFSRLCVTCVSHPFLLCTATAVWLVSSPVPLFMIVATILPHHHSTLEVTWREIPGGRLVLRVPASGGVVGVGVAMSGGCAVQFSFSLPVCFFFVHVTMIYPPPTPLPPSAAVAGPCGIGHPARVRRPAWGWCCVCLLRLPACGWPHTAVKSMLEHIILLCWLCPSAGESAFGNPAPAGVM